MAKRNWGPRRFHFVLALCLCAAARPVHGQATAALPARVGELVGQLAGEDPAARAAADRELEGICLRSTRPGASSERRAVAGALVEALGREDLPASAQLWVVRRLGQIGQYEATRPLERLLGDASNPALRDEARRALEAIPTIPALRALRKALASAEGEFRGAIIRSLGQRRDLLSVGPILDIARSGPPELRLVALEALAEIGERSALDALVEALESAEGDARERLLEIYVRFAYRLKENQEGGAARRIFIRLMEMGGRWRVAGLVGIGQTGIPSEVPAVMKAVEDDDPAVRAAALTALESLRGGLPAIVERLDDAPPALRAGLIRALGRRRDAATDERAIDALIAATGSTHDGVRAAALGALANVRGERAANAFVELLGAGDESVRGAAERAISAATFRDAGVAVAGALGDAKEASTRAALLRVLGRRGDVAHLPLVIEAASDDSATTRAAAYGAIAAIAPDEAIDVLISALGRERGEALSAALAAIEHCRGEEVTGKLLERLDGELSAEARAGVVSVLGTRDDPRVVPVLIQGASDRDSPLWEASIRALARSSPPETLELLLEAARTASGDLQIDALRGCLRIAESIAGSERERALAIYVEVLDLATRDDERRLAIAGIGEVGAPDALEHIEPALDNPALQRDAGRAALRLAERLPESERDRAVALHRRLLELDLDAATLGQTLNRLRKLGAPVDYASHRGFVTRWWLLGPFPRVRLGDWVAAVTAKKVDTGAPVTAGEKELRWKPHETDDPSGIVDLGREVDPGDGLGAFLYTEVTVADATDAVLRLGSDDQLHCWLNGEKVHEFTGSRGVAPDQDAVRARLQAGVNRILLAVINDAGGWAGVLRLTDSEGRPLAFETVALKSAE